MARTQSPSRARWRHATTELPLFGPLPGRALEVLVAEADPTLRALLTETLENEGYRVVAVRTGRELIARFAWPGRPRSNFALIVADIGLPERSGLQAISFARRTGWAGPVIFVAGVVTAWGRSEAERLGAAFVFSQPINLETSRMPAPWLSTWGPSRSFTTPSASASDLDLGPDR